MQLPAGILHTEYTTEVYLDLWSFLGVNYFRKKSP